jgi:hypothetical protein
VGTTPKHPADLYLLPCTRACIRRQDCGIVIVSMYRIKRSCGKGKGKQDVGDSTDPQVSGKLGLITVRNGQVKDPDTQMLGETPCTKGFYFSRGISMLWLWLKCRYCRRDPLDGSYRSFGPSHSERVDSERLLRESSDRRVTIRQWIR